MNVKINSVFKFLNDIAIYNVEIRAKRFVPLASLVEEMRSGLAHRTSLLLICGRTYFAPADPVPVGAGNILFAVPAMSGNTLFLGVPSSGGARLSLSF